MLKSEYDKQYYQKNRERLIQKTKDWHNKNRDKSNKYKRNWQKELKHKKREEILEKLGCKCNNPNCPIPKEKMDKNALQIDHINGGGYRERKKYSSRSDVRYLQNILDHIENYQLLCAYCNWVKQFGGGV